MQDSHEPSNQALQPTADRREQLLLMTSTLYFIAMSAFISRSSAWFRRILPRAIAASMVLLASCSVFPPVIDVVPVGSLQRGVVFYLGDVLRPHPEFTVTG